MLLMCCLLPSTSPGFTQVPQEDNPDATQLWGEATDFVCSFRKAFDGLVAGAAMELTMSLIRKTFPFSD